MSKYKYIFFDLDGTVIDSSEGIIRSYIYALSKFGITVNDRNDLRKCIGPPLTYSFKTYFGMEGEDVDKAVAYYREVFSAGLMLKNRLYDGMLDLLKALRNADKKVIIATSKLEIYVRPILEDLGILDCFDFVAGSLLGDVRVKKEDVIAYILEQINITDISECVMVGDRARDIEGAAYLGVDGIGVLYGFGTREELEATGARYIAKDVDELKKILIG